MVRELLRGQCGVLECSGSLSTNFPSALDKKDFQGVNLRAACAGRARDVRGPFATAALKHY